MLIDAEFDNGQIRLLRPMRFAHDHFRVQVDIPSEEIIPDGEGESARAWTDWPLSEEAAEFKRLTDTLFGGDYRYVREKSDKEILSEVLSDKYA